MQQPELTEEQFFFLKGLCKQRALLAALPDYKDDAPEAIKANHAVILEKFTTLIQLGFMENATEKFGPEIAEMKRRTGIGFTPFIVKEQTYKMFSVPEGRVN
jgi:hypothetical protein